MRPGAVSGDGADDGGKTFDKPMEIGSLLTAAAGSTMIGNNTFTFLACVKSG